MCEEESDDPEAVHKLLEINDSIHRTIERYRLIKKGDVDAAQRIPQGTLGTTTGVSKNANNELSLIDFDPEPSSNGSASQPAAQGGNSLENDLLGLSMDEPVPSGGISLGPGKLLSPYEVYVTCDGNTDLLANPPVNPLANQPTDLLANPPASSTPPVQQTPAPFKPNYDILSSLNSSRPTSQVSTPVPGFSQPSQALPQQATTAAAPPKTTTDPFASLVSGSSRGPSPFSPSPSKAPPTANLGGTGDRPAEAEEDEWDFTSSLPESGALPSTNKVAVLDSPLRIEFVARRHPNQARQIHIVGMFSNRTSQPLQELHFQVAVEKVST